MLHRHPFRVSATKLSRHQFLHLAAGAAALPAVSRIARAQSYPARPVRLIVASAAGSMQSRKLLSFTPVRESSGESPADFSRHKGGDQ
jgi:hypothetical protein